MLFYPLSTPGLKWENQPLSAEDCRLLLSYARLVLTYSTPSPAPASTPSTASLPNSSSSSVLENGLKVSSIFSPLSLLLSHLSPSRLCTLNKTLLDIASLQPAPSVMDIFLIASLSSYPEIASFSSNWLKGKTPRYTSLEEIPIGERQLYDEMVNSLLLLYKESPGSYTTGLVQDETFLLPPTVRCTILDILSRCYLSEHHVKQLMMVLMNNLANLQLSDKTSIQITTATYRLVTKASEILPTKSLSLLAKVIYMSLWKTLRVIYSTVKTVRQSKDSRETPLYLLLKDCMCTALSLLATLTNRVPEVIPLRCEDVSMCVKMIKEESMFKTSHTRAHQEPLTVDFFKCFCSLRHAFHFLPTVTQEAILVCENEYEI